MQGPGNRGAMLSEINVTPLVDVMLVLLIIFMISSSIETLQVQQEKQRIEKEFEIDDMPDQKVPVNLPKTNAEPVNLAEDRKLVMTINERAEFFIGPTKILSCLDLAPRLDKVLGTRRSAWGPNEDKAFKLCLDALEAKLSKNAKLKADKEMYLRADEGIPYGMVLKVMARIRASGVAKFGLVAEPEEAPKGAAQ
ncbi:MAG: biopolymer transporter ExbD [Deltaproteobacteria bacterium]|nr:biopolymer transporter ExbD [Deltaproteobacteria bacterium]